MPKMTMPECAPSLLAPLVPLNVPALFGSLSCGLFRHREYLQQLREG